MDPKIVVHLDSLNNNGTPGISQNKIIEVLDFLDDEACKNIIKYIESKPENWGHVASYKYRLGHFPEPDVDLELFNLSKSTVYDIVEKINNHVSFFFSKDVSLNTIHAQKFQTGGLGHVHSDNTDENGDSNHFEINKYAAIIYLNDQYSGGEVFFPEHEMDVRPKAGSLVLFPGGKENIHGVREITSGLRYTIISFWDFSDSKYSEEREAWRSQKMEDWSKSWYEEWDSSWRSKWSLWNFA